MTAEMQQAIAEEVFVQMLAERVVEKLLARQKQAVVVYTGSDIGFEAGLEGLKALKAQGYTFRVLMSRSAAKILDQEAIRAALQPVDFWIERPEGPSVEMLAYSYDTFIVPAMTVNTAAHVANCMADSPCAALIFDAMMRGKTVIGAVDGCCPDNAVRVQRGFKMPESMKQKMRDHMEVLRSFGMRWTTADQLTQRIRRVSTLPDGKASTASAAVQPQPQAGAVSYQGGKVLSGRYVANCPANSVLSVPKGTLVTQMATDEARKRHITIQILA